MTPICKVEKESNFEYKSKAHILRTQLRNQFQWTKYELKFWETKFDT
jgi:hypothetical protein